MLRRTFFRTVIVIALASVIVDGSALARGRGGGGRRGGSVRSHSRSRSVSHGRGTVRYSGRSRSSARRTSTYTRSTGRSRARYSGASYRRTRTAAVSRRPANYGSIRHSSARRRYSTPGRYASRGPVVRAPRVGAGRIEGPRGGEIKAVRGPRGRGAVKVEGPRGGEAAAVRGRYGRGAVGVRGPRGYGRAVVGRRGVGGIWGVRGPHGRAVVGRLPRGYVKVDIKGYPYYHHNYYWYRPYWYGGTVYYSPVYPSVGYYYAALPEDHTTTVIDNRKYYYSNGVYYTEGTKNGEEGYLVIDPPEESTTQPSVVASEDAAAPDPFDTLRAMSDYLGKLKQFTFTAKVTTDDIQESGEKIQLSSRRTVSVRRPDRIVAELRTDGDDRRVTYDGKALNIFSRTHNLYGSEKMPDSIEGTLDMLAQDYGMVLPLGDMLYPDVYGAVVPSIRTGQYVGQHIVDERQCHHLLFTQDVIDWEIWIQADDKPLPRKLVITYKQQTGKPTFSATLPLWELTPKFTADFFDFNPPSGAQKIQILPVMIKDAETPTGTSTATQKTE